MLRYYKEFNNITSSKNLQILTIWNERIFKRYTDFLKPKNIWKTSITKDETLSFVVLTKHYVFFFWFKSKQSGFTQTRLKQNSSKEHKKTNTFLFVCWNHEALTCAYKLNSLTNKEIKCSYYNFVMLSAWSESAHK